jgi:hypothetical protein
LSSIGSYHVIQGIEEALEDKPVTPRVGEKVGRLHLGTNRLPAGMHFGGWASPKSTKWVRIHYHF